MVFTRQYLEEDQESGEEDMEEPHCPGTEVLEGLVGRIKDTVRSPRSSGPPGPELLGLLTVSLHLPQQEECDCSILSGSLSPSCHSPWVCIDLGFQIWG